jgi:sigma-B regulation protein RsbU (phosphoserine phosphatase)
MARPPLSLPPAPATLHARGRRAADFLAWTWAGRVLLASVFVVCLAHAGAPIPCGLDVLASIAVFLYAVWGALRLSRYLIQRLLWRIRTKLIVSYLFIAVVPVVLLLLLFGLAALMFSSLVASHIVTSDIQAKAQVLHATARSTLTSAGRAGAADVDALVGPAREVHPEISYAVVRGGRVAAARGEVPAALPAWVKPPGFAGLVKEGDHEDLRAVWMEGSDFVIIAVPLDDRLFVDLRERMGVQFLGAGGKVDRPGGKGLRIDIDSIDESKLSSKPAGGGMTFFATPERRRWTDGEVELDPLTFRFDPWELGRRLSPSALNMADLLVKALAAVAGVFLVMYAIALLVGLLLARSITKGIHELSHGTERLRQGDFSHPIRVFSRDQLGDLAESFNVMAESVRDLLREQADKERLEEELRIARKIQMSLLPQGTVTLPGLRVAALCLPAAEVGGDYYDLLPLSNTRMGVLVADVSGKGTSAALYMAELKGLVLSLSRIYESPARLLGEANRILSANMDPRSFITMTYAVVDTARRTMTYARAGHNPLIQLSKGVTRVLTPAGLGLGMDRGERFEEILEEAEVPLDSGDVFLFFTDGLSEAMNGRAELFGERRLRDVLEQVIETESDEVELKDRILDEIRRFVGDAAQHDDMTMVILKVV